MLSFNESASFQISNVATGLIVRHQLNAKAAKSNDPDVPSTTPFSPTTNGSISSSPANLTEPTTPNLTEPTTLVTTVKVEEGGDDKKGDDAKVVDKDKP